MTNANRTDLALIIDTARACAQGWAEQAREESPRTWPAANPIPDEDIAFVERERIERDLSEEESVVFGRAFREEYDACLAQKAERLGWAPATDYGHMINYATGETIRPATREDWLRAARLGDEFTGAHKDLDGTTVYCDGPECDPTI